MKTARAFALVMGTAVLLQTLVNAPREYNPELAIHASRDLAVIIAIVIATARLRLAPIIAALGTVLWLCALFYEWVRSIGITAMSQEPLLYDAYFLVGHLYTLMSDLMGGRALAIFLGAFSSLLAITVLTGWLFRRIQKQFAPLPVMTSIVAIGVVFGAAWGVEHKEFAEGQNSLVDFVDNVERSSVVRDEITTGISPSAYKAIRHLKLKEKPSVHIYIVESYGSGIRRRSIRQGYYEMIGGFQQRLTDAGWTMRTGVSEAPVMGGRSWLADATMLSGRQVKYESVWRHLLPKLKDIVTVPNFFKDQGYTTLLMRQNDRARPGLPLEDAYGFDRTVFHPDLNYSGRPYGWAEIPDQYALGYLREEILPEISADPHFVFVHLATSHIPWDEVPPMLEDWRDHNAYQGRKKKEESAKEQKRQLKNQLKRFKRKDTVRLRRLKPSQDNVEDYLKIIEYSMGSVVDHVLALEEPPDMVIITGDHQPPLYRKNTDFTVPMHVLVRDPELLREFRKRGFRKGLRSPKLEKRVYHEGFLSILVRSLARSQGLMMPSYLSRGAGKKQGAGKKKKKK